MPQVRRITVEYTRAHHLSQQGFYTSHFKHFDIFEQAACSLAQKEARRYAATHHASEKRQCLLNLAERYATNACVNVQNFRSRAQE